MLRALIRKKLLEFRANKGPWAFALLLAFSLLPLVRLATDRPEATLLPLGLLSMVAWFMAPSAAAAAFRGDFTNQANRFLEYLPAKRSAIWLASYSSGLVLLCLAAITLFWLEVLLFPIGTETNAIHHSYYDPDFFFFGYLLHGRWGMAVFFGSALFLGFSVVTFSAAYLDRKDLPPTNNPATGGMFLWWMFMPVCVGATLGFLQVVPSGLALSPVLLTTGLLYSAGGYGLFALAPKHITPAGRAWLGTGLFLAISTAMVGQLYLYHLEWRVFDPSLPFEIERVYRPRPEDPNLLLADVRSYRSGNHCVSIRVADHTYHDLGRWLTFLEVPDDNGLLHFVNRRREFGRWKDFVRMAPDGTRRRSFAIPGVGRHGVGSYAGRDVQWLAGKGLLVYAAYEHREDSRLWLCAADSDGRLLKQFPVDSARFLATPTGKVLAIGPGAEPRDAMSNGPLAHEEKPYMLIDLESDSIRRFGLPGSPVRFARDLRRVLCSRFRIENGRRYQSGVLVELPSLAEELMIPEGDLEATELTSQVNLALEPAIPTDEDGPNQFLMVNDGFDKAAWVKRRVDGDYFRYSIALVDLDTGKREIAVPESATTPMPVVMTQGTAASPTNLLKFTPDQAGITYTIGPRVYLCDIDERQSILLADASIGWDSDAVDAVRLFRQPQDYSADLSPSGRRVLRLWNHWVKPTSGMVQRPQLEFAAIDVFEGGKPVRVYTSQRYIEGAQWLDDERIVFHEADAIYVLESTGGPPQQVFPYPARHDRLLR